MALRELDGTTGYAVHGSLTLRDVAAIREALASKGSPPDLIVDLRAAPTPLAPALLDLAVTVGEAHGRLRLLGLTTASERLLRLLGIDPGTLAGAGIERRGNEREPGT